MPHFEDASLDPAHLLEIIDAAPDAVVVVNREGHVVYWNAGAERIFGYPRSATVGAPLDLIIPERLRERHWAAFTQAVASGTTRYGASDLLAVPAITSDGRTISIEFTVVLSGGAGGTTYVGGLIREVTERRARENELRRRLAALESGQPPNSDAGR